MPRKKSRDEDWWEHRSPEYMRKFHQRRAMRARGVTDLAPMTQAQAKARYGERGRPGKVKKTRVEPTVAPTECTIADYYRSADPLTAER